LKQVLAIDLGGTKTAIALVDQTGAISRQQKLAAAHSFDETLSQIAGAFPNEASAIGVVVPGIYDPRHGTVWAPNLWGQDFHPLRRELEDRFGLPVEIGSDRTGSVLAEQWLGIARGLNDVLFVAVGTGIGVGIVCGGRPVEGAHGIAGAAGWMVIGGEWKSEYVAAGGWETEAAGPAVGRRAGMDSAEAVVAAARQGAPAAVEALRRTADYLALGIANLISIFDPEMVVLGGGVMQAGDLLLERIRAQALVWTQPIAAKLVRIELTALRADAGLLGAARLAFMEKE
jgi:glucokinase